MSGERPRPERPDDDAPGDERRPREEGGEEQERESADAARRDEPEEADQSDVLQGEEEAGEDPFYRAMPFGGGGEAEDTARRAVLPQAEEAVDDTAEPSVDPAPPDRDIFGRTPKHTPDWSHRRGEPRVFVLLWTVYLMFCAAAMFSRSGGMASFDPVAFRPSARLGLLMMMVGIGVLWPLMRLSQAMPREGGVRATLKDAAIILVTGHALILPQLWLARWGGGVVVALSVLFVCWTLLIGSVIASTQGPPRGREGSGSRPGGRAAGVLCCLVLVLSGGLVALADAGRVPGNDAIASRPAWMLSPLTAIYEIARDRPWTGRPAMVGPAHRAALGATGLAAAASWGVALVACRRRRIET